MDDSYDDGTGLDRGYDTGPEAHRWRGLGNTVIPRNAETAPTRDDYDTANDL
ncbi:MAG: hypothetical protein SVU88_00205 [Candidatus Nanohaloarchaea archaeon]|nr:hypothetical protein [Candidatus Nanohaloarchaea archaeon]